MTTAAICMRWSVLITLCVACGCGQAADTDAAASGAGPRVESVNQKAESNASAYWREAARRAQVNRAAAIARFNQAVTAPSSGIEGVAAASCVPR